MISFCQMTMNRLSETKHCVEKCLPYVDKVIIVDGGSIDDTVFYFRNWSQQEPKIEFYIHPWRDQFSEQRNNYIRYVPDHTWALVADPDEWFEDRTLEKLKKLTELGDQKGYTMFGFQCRSVTMKGPERAWEHVDDYWKGLFFKKFPSTKYVGNPHETLLKPEQRPPNYAMVKTDLIYEHVKQENVIWHRGARNMFAGGGGPNLGKKNPRWIRLREVCNELGIKSWHEFDRYLLKGNISDHIKNIMYEFKDLDGWDGSSEHRELYKLYFRVYHPDEEPEEFRDTHIP